jgi:uncharacterized protein YhbP (UPF0306 family)
MDLRALIGEYLQKAVMLQVATSVGDRPWACTVYFASDDSLNLYWISKADRRHSQEILKNPHVAGTVVLPHTPGDDVRGIQLSGTAGALSDPSQAAVGLQHYAKRFGMGQDRVDAIRGGTDGHVCYRIKPNLFVLFDEVHFPDNPRQEYRPV